MTWIWKLYLYYNIISLVHITSKQKNISQFVMVTNDPTIQAFDTNKPLVKSLEKKGLN